MNKYEVLSDCYVPVGRGFRHKRAGQVVTLSDVDADLIAEHIRLVEESEQEPAQEKPKRKRVAKRNTKPEAVEQPAVEVDQPVVDVEQPIVEEVSGEVTSDDGDPQASHE